MTFKVGQWLQINKHKKLFWKIHTIIKVIVIIDFVVIRLFDLDGCNPNLETKYQVESKYNKQTNKKDRKLSSSYMYPTYYCTNLNNEANIWTVYLCGLCSEGWLDNRELKAIVSGQVTGSLRRQNKRHEKGTFTAERPFDPWKLDSLMKCLFFLAILAESHNTMELLIVLTTRLTAKLVHFVLKRISRNISYII